MLSSSRCVLGVVVALLCSTGIAAQEPWTITFDDGPSDAPPAGFSLAAMRQSDAGRWLVQEDENGRYLVHRADVGAPGYALAVAEQPTPDDLIAAVRLRMQGGSRTGGLVWRYENHRNYYTLLLDLDRGELSIYRITEGNRVLLDRRDELELDPTAWHVLKVIHIENEIRVMLGGVRVFDERDRRNDRRSSGTGRVGVVATGTSEIWFDDLHVEAKRGHRP
jgi:hypothetical protein